MYQPLLQTCWPWGMAEEATPLSFCKRAGKNRNGSESEEPSTGSMERWLPISKCFSSWQYCSCFRHSLVIYSGRTLVRADSGMMPRVESVLATGNWDRGLPIANSVSCTFSVSAEILKRSQWSLRSEALPTAINSPRLCSSFTISVTWHVCLWGSIFYVCTNTLLIS